MLNARNVVLLTSFRTKRLFKTADSSEESPIFTRGDDPSKSLCYQRAIITDDHTAVKAAFNPKRKRTICFKSEMEIHHLLCFPKVCYTKGNTFRNVIYH